MLVCATHRANGRAHCRRGDHIWWRVFQFLEPNHQQALPCVCKNWKDLIEARFDWPYIYINHSVTSFKAQVPRAKQRIRKA